MPINSLFLLNFWFSLSVALRSRLYSSERCLQLIVYCFCRRWFQYSSANSKENVCNVHSYDSQFYIVSAHSAWIKVSCDMNKGNFFVWSSYDLYQCNVLCRARSDKSRENFPTHSFLLYFIILSSKACILSVIINFAVNIIYKLKLSEVSCVSYLISLIN